MVSNKNIRLGYLEKWSGGSLKVKDSRQFYLHGKFIINEEYNLLNVQ